jgi:hypothetical protein
MVVAYCGRVGLVCTIFWISKKLYLVLVSTAILYVFLLQQILLPLNMDKNESLNCSNICAFVNIISVYIVCILLAGETNIAFICLCLSK